MYKTRRVPIVELNDYLSCKLCKGYYIDATTIIECLHTFCRSCIVQYLGKNKYCPVCDVQVHKSKPLLNIRPDKTLQDIVYKLVPHLFQNEMCKRRQFYSVHPDVRPSNLEQCGEAPYQHILSPDETICLTLNYSGSTGPPRYLRCPAAVSILHLQKLLRSKYGLLDHYRVDIFHNQDCLSPHLTLIDIAYIYLWRRKGPLELTYRIYENKCLKVDVSPTIASPPSPNNNESPSKSQCVPEEDQCNNWKEVQLRISETGEMCFTDIGSTLVLNQDVTNATNKIGDEALPNSETDIKLESGKNNQVLESKCNIEVKTTVEESEKDNSKTISETTESNTTPISTIIDCDNKASVTEKCISTTSNTTTIISTPISVCTVSNTLSCDAVKSIPVSTSKEVFNGKRKIKGDVKEEPVAKQVKQTVLNHTLNLGIRHLSNSHPLKRNFHIQKSIENVNSSDTCAASLGALGVSKTGPNKNSVQNSTQCSSMQPKPTIINKEINNVASNHNNLTVTPQWSQNKTPTAKLPCYSPKVKQNPVINIPKVQTTSTILKSKVPITTILNHKLALKSKPTNAIGYKTLREPPKTWNPQIPRSLLLKGAEQKESDLKNAKPAKFFKMRNNIPRYLGNPASGVKPLYQIHNSPEKDKTVESKFKVDKSEIKKHSIVKIDPKTLKPISEKAPESSSLSNLRELKINTTSVPIFSPLKCSPKSERKSPKSEGKSPKSPQSPKSKTPSPSSKRDKLNLNYVPTNPFIPNLTSQTLSPNQFLYPPGFPTYDHRLVAAYHNLLFGQGFAFASHAIPNLNFELSQRKALESAACTSPTTSTAPVQLSSKEKRTRKKSNSEATKSDSSTSLQNSAHNLNSSHHNNKTKLKYNEVNRNEKSLENAVEKLTRSKVSELKNTNVNSNTNGTEKEEIPSADLFEASNEEKTNDTNCKTVNDSNISNNVRTCEDIKNSERIAESEKQSNIQSIQNGDNKTVSNNNTIENVSFESVPKI